MRLDRKSAVYDLALRASGIALALVGALALRHLYHLVHLPPRHEATAIELGLAAVGFLGFSFGGGLLWLGAHIHDQVQISPRWAQGASRFDIAFPDAREASPPTSAGNHNRNDPPRGKQ